MSSSAESSPSKKKGKGNAKPKKDTGAVLDREMVAPICGLTAPESVAKEKFYITTAINYTNGDPHAGHAYEAITSDVIARYHRRYGRDVFFLTGSDEHGQKVEQSAIKQGVSPQDIADKYSQGFKQLNKQLNISNDYYIRTTAPHHAEFCRSLWKRVRDKGDIYLKDYVGWYNVHEEKYVTDKEAEADNYQDEYGRPYEKKSEESYFFRMSKYQDALLEYIQEKNPLFIQPESRKREILAFLSEPLQDLCVSRTVCQWGIKCPEDPDYTGNKSHVMYVWFDALSNYASGVNYLDCKEDPYNWKRFWPTDVHIIGKDITRFHCVIWPTMLMSADLPLPRTVFGHGFVQAEGGIKMSKSLGNVVDPVEVLKIYPSDSVRFYIARATTYGEDLSFSLNALCADHNALLKDNLGNLLHRATSLCAAYCDGEIPEESTELLNGGFPFDLDGLRNLFEVAFSTRPADTMMDAETSTKDEKLREHISICRSGFAFQMKSGADAVTSAIASINSYLQELHPWNVRGDDAASVAKRRGSVRGALEGIYAAAHFLQPYCPNMAVTLFHKIGVKPTYIPALSANFDNLPPGTKTYVGPILFKQLGPGIGEVDSAEFGGKKVKQTQADIEAGRAAKKAEKEAIRKRQVAAASQPVFTKMEFKVGRILEIWPHPNSDKLFCEKIDVGEEMPREIVSGLQRHYEAKDLKSKLVVVATNLKARKLANVLSSGMVICASAPDGSAVEILEPPADSEVGERIGLKGEDPNEFEPEAPNRVDRKKIFEEVAKDLKTNDDRAATWNGVTLHTSKGSCTVKTLQNTPLR